MERLLLPIRRHFDRGDVVQGLKFCSFLSITSSDWATQSGLGCVESGGSKTLRSLYNSWGGGDEFEACFRVTSAFSPALWPCTLFSNDRKFLF